MLAGSWAVRETFVAVVTTNVPMLFPHAKKFLWPRLRRISSSLSRSKNSRVESKLSHITSLDTWRRKSRHSSRIASPGHGVSNESEQHIVEGHRLADLTNRSSLGKADAESYTEHLDAARIQRQVEIEVLGEHAEPYAPNASFRGGNYTSAWSRLREESVPARTEFFGDRVHQDAYTKHV